jgi:ABC-type multidrug transport system fused ATPase/permease subunit
VRLCCPPSAASLGLDRLSLEFGLISTLEIRLCAMTQKLRLNFFSIGKILPKSYRLRLRRLSAGRIAANSLDLVGLAGVALLATSFGSIASGAVSRSPIALPVIGEVTLTEMQAVYLAFLVAAIFLLKSFFSIWLNLRTSLTVAQVESEFSKDIANHFFLSPQLKAEVPGSTVAEFQNQALYSTSAIAMFLNSRISLIAEGSLAVAMVLLFALVNPTATVAMLIYLASVMWILSLVLTRKIRRNGRLAMQGSEQSLRASRDLFGIRREAESFGVSGAWIDKFARGRKQAANGAALIYTLNSLPRYVIETSLILGIFGFLAGIVVFSDLPSQAVTIGVFLAGGLRLVASLLPLQAAINSLNDGANRGQDAFDVLLSFNYGSSRDHVGISNPSSAIDLEIADVCFSYPSGAEVLSGLNLKVEAGTKTAIVGPSGAGKTTVFELSTGFLEPKSGWVTLGGHQPRDLLLNCPGVVGIVPQRPQLVTGTLAENVSLEGHSATDLAKVTECLEIAGLGGLVFSVSGGLSAPVIPDAGQFSGGEIQRLGIARALYRDPKILFLDEATSALDSETEALVTRVLDLLKGQMTIILIAHRLSTVMNADRIIYMDKGKVLGQGTFAELKAAVPEFSKAVKLMDLAEKSSD